MNAGKYVFAQIIALVNPKEFAKCVKRYQGDYRARTLKCWQQFLGLSFGQLTQRESLRDLVSCLEAHQSKLYHLGFSQGISRTTLADANEKRDWRIYADFAQVLITQARLANPALSLEGLSFDNQIYALDSSTIDLCLEVFWWAKFRKHKAAIKLHTLLDIRCQIPCFVHITDGLSHDVNVLDILDFEADAFYVMDRGYVDWARLHRINQARAFFVTRAKSNFAARRLYSKAVDKQSGLGCDQTICLKNYQAAKDYPSKLRRVKYYDQENDKTLVFLSNNFEVTAMEIALLYKNRWQIELFFKWIKQHLRIKVFWGESANAVKTQIWVAVCTFILVKILKDKLQILQSMNEILQILSVSVFDKTPVNQLFTKTELQKPNTQFPNQLNLFDL
ncbi:MAG: IS4 family transposase [Lewinellaceae bacterium]|nr:IS4 family transposase [Lewinellaceae bacterium]MCB9081417.1 IS4 family transposase [Lewinellaceae bacterium]